MRLSVYLGENEIRTVLGRSGKTIEIMDCLSVRLKEGALINDVVTEEAAVKEVLNGIRKRYGKYRRHVYLTMGGNQIITKVLSAPRLPRCQMMELVRRELSDLILPSEKDGYVYDYSIVRKKNRDHKGRTILCVAMKRSVIHEYQTLFSECGMKLKAIDVAVDGLNSLVDFLPSFRNKTFIMAVADGRNMMTSLYIDGVYAYTNRMRLVDERGTSESLEEMVKVIRSVIHFCKMQRDEFELDFVCLCGLGKEEVDSLIPEIVNNEDIAVTVPGPESWITVKEGLNYSMDQYMYVTGSLLGSRKSLDLIGAAKQKAGRGEEEKSHFLAACLLPAAVITVFLGNAVRNEIAVRNMREEIQILEERLSVKERKEALAEEKQLKEKLASLRILTAGQSAVKKEAAKMPEMNSAVRSYIFGTAAGKLELSELEYTQGVLRFDGKSRRYEEISDYVRELEESGLFSAVEYSGFTNVNPVTKEKEDWYYVQLACMLKTPE
ncbi:hypothetical protein CE91St54_08910 [Hungatella hathewayi]|uniref:Type IV pilus assembly protein PilM n=1 Tax=Hungatella hathewayi TaxID=154046 RepID=A0AA37N628_9FIRM|nr:pilus assembly protein PilM [Hungatella hathewayi]GKG98960.1 hypothetical protein CE91St55_09420 [Hungatella hathewayi]GKH05783.1 hypothetical protein CE91St54_08910 [Hungatella hathewayi]